MLLVGLVILSVLVVKLHGRMVWHQKASALRDGNAMVNTSVRSFLLRSLTDYQLHRLDWGGTGGGGGTFCNFSRKLLGAPSPGKLLLLLCRFEKTEHLFASGVLLAADENPEGAV